MPQVNGESTVISAPEPAITGPDPVADDGPGTPTRTTRRPAWRLRIKLLAALVFPVFLETLDYTGVWTQCPMW